MNQFIFTEEIYCISSPPTVVLTKPWAEVSVPERDLLTKIIAALRISIQQVAIRYQPSLDLSQWPDKPNRLIYFGPLPAGLSYYELIRIKEVALVASEELQVLQENEAARKKLWTALKQLFFL